jgi:probable F420-dependent oxidoreductase
VFAYLASITTTLHFMTGVYVLPLHNPFAVAKAVATLDQLSNGRFIFGLGVGWLKEEFDYVGMNWEDRALRSNEYMKLLTALWSQERPSFKGKTIAAEGFYFNPKTVQQPRPPFVIGGHGEASYKRAARLADGFYITAQNMDDARQQIKRLREVERNHQRAKPLELSIGVGPITVDTVKQLEDLGVERIIPGRELVSRDSLGALRNFHDRVLSKVS